MKAGKKETREQKLEKFFSKLITAVTLTGRNAFVVCDYSTDKKLNAVFGMMAVLSPPAPSFRAVTFPKSEEPSIKSRFTEMAAFLVAPINPAIGRGDAEIARDTAYLGKAMYDKALEQKMIRVTHAKPR